MLIFNDLTAGQFAALRAESGMPELDAVLMEKCLETSLFTLRYELDGRTAGMLRAVGDGVFVVVICDVLVLPEYRRRGIGREMLEAALRKTEDQMPFGRWVSVMLTCAGTRTEYYKRFGFAPLDGGVQGIAMQTFVKGRKY